jgi:hypothetical protein
MADLGEQSRNYKLPGSMHVLQTVSFAFVNISKQQTQLIKEKQAFQRAPEMEDFKHYRRPSEPPIFVITRSQEKDSSLIQTRVT